MKVNDHRVRSESSFFCKLLKESKMMFAEKCLFLKLYLPIQYVNLFWWTFIDVCILEIYTSGDQNMM